MENEKLEKFISNFNLSKYGFYDITPYTDGTIGISARKYFGKGSKNVTQLSVYVYSDDSNKSHSNSKPISVHATFGEAVSEGVRMRAKYNAFDPVDIESRDEYYYDIVTNEFFNKKRKKIDANKIIEDVHDQHIKSTKIIRGLWLRIKIFFWRKFLNAVLRSISKLFYFLLFLISGDRYSYESFFEQETLNDRIIKSRLLSKREMETKVELKKSTKVKFFSYEVKQWPIIFYSIFHILVYGILMTKNYKPSILANIFKNNFLTVVYVILSLWIIETIAPKLFMFLIRFFSKLSSRTQYKKINI